MNTGGEAADQIVRISLNGAEVAIKLAGEGAKNLAILLYTILSDQKKNRGKSRLSAMLRSGKELKVFSINNADLKLFVQEAKKYGVLYCALRNPKGNPDGMTDVMVRAEDASKINRIVERFKFAAVDTAKIKAEVEQSREEKAATEQEHEQEYEPAPAPANERELDELLDDMFGSSESTPSQGTEQIEQKYEIVLPEDAEHEQYEIRQEAQNTAAISEDNANAILDELYEADPANPTTAETEKDPLLKPFLQTQGTIDKGTDIGRRSVRAPAQDNFDKEAWAARKKEERKSAYELIDKTVDTLSTSGEAFQTYLDVQSRFERYSVSNALLITAQKPDATRLGSFDYWKRQNAFVKKNEQSITILEPGDEYLKEDGTVGVSYNPKKVFDQTQTNQRRKVQPQVTHGERTLLKALINNAPVKVQPADNLPFEAKGAVYDPVRQTIFVQRGMNGADMFRCLSMELAHVELSKGDPSYQRATGMFQAYCISYMLCKRNGIDTSGYSFKKLPERYAAMETQEVRNELSDVRNASSDISARMSAFLDRAKDAPQQDYDR